MRRLATPFGYVLFIGMMATGYYYNITFVQLGLVDLGVQVVGISEWDVAMGMALLALLTCAVALATGLCMRRRGWATRFVVKLRLVFCVVVAQTVLTGASLLVDSHAAFIAWIVAGSVTLGVAVPVTFSMTVDLIATRHRGYVAAAITAITYFLAASFAFPWTLERFVAQVFPLMIGGVIGLGILAFARLPLVEVLMAQHQQDTFGRGRFVRPQEGGRTRVNRRLFVLIVLMFGIFFVDSLGFLRIIETPSLMQGTWHSPDWQDRMFIGATHAVAALVAGILYANFRERSLFLWIFGIFALVHLLYTFGLSTGPAADDALATPMLYAIAVSLYTVVNFAIWPDVSTPETISFNAAIGVALSGWTATFLSTALAIQWRFAGMPLETHLRIVDALAMVFFLGVLLVYLLGGRGGAVPGRTGAPGSRA